MKLSKSLRIAFVLATGGLLALVMIVLATRPGRAAGPWYVAPGGDDGNDCLSPGAPCATINGAIDKASPGDTIYVATGTYTGTGDQVVLLDKDATLSGGWDETFTTQGGTSTIDGEGARRALFVNSGVTASLDSVTVKNGLVAGMYNSGAGIFNDGGTVTLNDCVVSGNSSDWYGGGIYSTGGTLTLNGSTVSQNTAKQRGGGICSQDGSTATLNDSAVSGNPGGGIYNDGTLTLNNSTVSGNTTSFAAGGGIYIQQGTVTLTSSTVSANTGHGIENDGGTLILNSGTVTGNTGRGIGNDGGTVTLHNTTVSDNKGGGIYSSSGDLTLNSSTVSGNTAITQGGGGGGGISMSSGTVVLTNSTVSGNAAGYRGGGIDNYSGSLTLHHSTVTGNSASLGGGIYGATVNLKNSILAGNMADSGPDCSGTVGSSGYNLIGDTSDCTFTPGAGDLTNISPGLAPLIASPGYHPLLPSSPAIDAVPIGQCTLPSDQRGAARPQGAACDMGAYEYTTPGPPASVLTHAGTPQTIPPLLPLWVPLQALVLDSIGTPVEGATVSFSAPSSGASGTFEDSGTVSTTAVSHESGIATPATFTANGLAGSYIVTATVDGVAVPASFLLSNHGWYVAPGGSDANDCHTAAMPCATVNGALGKSGFAVDDTVLVARGTYSGSGDQVVLLDKDVRLSGGWDDTFSAQEGRSTIDGEGVRNGITVEWAVATVIDRFAVQNGRVDSVGGALALSNSTVHGSNGSGINIWQGTVTLTSSTVSANTGRGIENDGGTLVLNNSTISGNTGGGIDNGGTLVLNNSTVSDNNGSGIHNGDGTVTLNNSTVSGNAGGGIYNGGTLVLNNSTISGNTGDGGLSNGFGCTSILNSSTVSGNSIDGDGGGIYNHDGTVTLQNTIVAGNSASGVGPDCFGYAGSGLGSAGYNLVGDTSDCNVSSTTGDLLDMDPRLFPLMGLPGYHPLPFTSPAIEAGNPAGCTDHLGNPLTTDQRGAPRPVDGDGDGDAICDIGAYEFDAANDPLTSVYLPLCTRNYYVCSDFFDDFSDPTSGWAVMDDSYVRTQYLDGEYRVLSKQSGYFYLFRAPTCDRQNYTVEVDARWAGTPGSSYGLLFGLASDYSRYYLFDMNTDYKQFRLLRRDPTGFVTVVPVTDAPAINGGTASNHIKVTRNGTGITLEVNGTVLGTWYDGAIGGRTGVGLVTNPYYDLPTSDARFDNFAVVSLPGEGSLVGESGSATPDGIEYVAPNARRDRVPVDTAW